MTHWIRTQDELEALAADLRGARQLALDSESDSQHHYTEKVCLVQLADDRGLPKTFTLAAQRSSSSVRLASSTI